MNPCLPVLTLIFQLKKATDDSTIRRQRPAMFRGTSAAVVIGLLFVGPLSAALQETRLEQPPTLRTTGSSTAPETPVETPAVGQQSVDDQTPTTGGQEKKLFFTFGGSKWRDVIEWLAETSGLALHTNDFPTGSFSYTDSKSFTVQEAIDRVNLFLLPEGYTLVRSGRLLSVINLNDPRSVKQLDALSRLVSIEDLDTTPDHDVVKCIFPLGELAASDAVEELLPLNLIKPPDVFTKTNQLLITDTAVKLRTARKIIGAFEPDTLENGTVVKSFSLQHVDAEDVLVVARPHLGLATGEMIGIDVSLSADVKGKNIFVTGVEDKVKVIEGLIKSIDVSEKKLTDSDGNAVLISHSVRGGNVDVVYNVLLTLLADKSVRLSMDKTAESIVALATPDIQKDIAETVRQLQAAEAEFAIIPLKTIDPYFAISLLEEMLDLSDSQATDASTSSSSSRRSPEEDWWRRRMGGGQQQTVVSKPKIDADPGNNRLFVRGKKHEIEQIKKIVAELDQGAATSTDTIRIIPIRGKMAEQALLMTVRFWRQANPVYYYQSLELDRAEPLERILNPSKLPPEDVEGSSTSPSDLKIPKIRLLTQDPNAKGDPIRCQSTPRGLLLQCEDPKALDAFEKLLRTIYGPAESEASPPVVFYLKHAKPDVAIRTLAELLDGAEFAKEAEADTLVNGLVGGSSSLFLGSLVTSREGTLSMISGTITVVAETRLNRLIAQGTVSDIEMIEGFLKIIDKDNSITSIETYGISHVIELEHVDASEVAISLREAFAGRVAGNSSTGSQGGKQQPNSKGSRGQGQEQDRQRQEDGGQNKGNEGRPSGRQPQGGSGGKNQEPQMTIAVHEPSNSLIVTAPEQLFREVEQLVKTIDKRSRQTVEVLKLPRDLSQELQQILTGQVPVGRRASGSGSTRTTPSSSQSQRKTNGR